MKPNIVREITSNMCRRNIPKTSFGVIAATAGLGPAGPAILLTAICFRSTILNFNLAFSFSYPPAPFAFSQFRAVIV